MLVLLEWTAGWMGAAAWTQSWDVVKRGHFRITAWVVVVLGVLTVVANGSAFDEVGERGLQPALLVGLAALAFVYLLVQYSATDVPGVVVGAAAAAVGAAGIALTGGVLDGWPAALAAVELIAGALLLGAVTNGMLLGHWYLNQPGLKPWALGRLTRLALVATALVGLLGLAGAGRLVGAETAGPFSVSPGSARASGSPSSLSGSFSSRSRGSRCGAHAGASTSARSSPRRPVLRSPVDRGCL